MGWTNKNESSPGRGERELRGLVFCRPWRGLDDFDDHTHGFTVGYYLSRLRCFHLPMLACRAVALAKARAQIFFQPGEGVFKGVVVLPVREIGDVIFADGFRQSFAGGEGWQDIKK